MRRQLSRFSLVVMFAVAAVTALATWATHSAVSSQERKLLKERAREVGLVLSTATGSIATQLDTIGGLLQRGDHSQAAFTRATASTVSAGAGRVTVAALRRTGTGYLVVAANGSGLQRGQLISDQRVSALDRAATAKTIVPTQVAGSGSDREIGFAVGPPQTPPGLIVYQQNDLGVLGPPRDADTSPFSEVQIVLYDDQTPRPAQAVVSTANRLPMSGPIGSTRLAIGDSSWLLQVRAVHPLVGGTAANAPWIVLGAGLVLCALLTTTSEIESRRRANAVALYRSEHRLAEELQRSLLPELPSIPGIEIAARYLAGTQGMQVGGDWYDVFPVGEKLVGIVIGDVVGHDISASATMSRVQAALRAYAVRERDPAVVLERLDLLIDSFQNERLATVFFGVLDLTSIGDAKLCYSNAGHLPPIVRRADGSVVELDQANSVLLGVGAVARTARTSARTTLAPGSMLTLFTDGLVEAPGQSLGDSVASLKDLIAGRVTASPEDLCDQITSDFRTSKLRDDIAVLTIRLAPS